MAEHAQLVAPMGAGPGSDSRARPAIQLVPVKGLPIVAIIVAGLITAIAADWRWWPWWSLEAS